MTYPFINYHLQVLAAQRTKLEANAKFTTLEEEIQAFALSTIAKPLAVEAIYIQSGSLRTFSENLF